MKYIKQFRESLQIDRKFIKICLLDLLFYLIIVPLSFLFMIITNKKAEALSTALGTKDLGSYLSTASAAELSFLSIDMQAFVFTFIAGALLIFVLGICSYSLTRMWIWNYIAKEKFSYAKYFKFVLLNLILLIAFLIIMFIIMMLAIISSYAMFIVMWLFLPGFVYFMLGLYFAFTKTGRIFESIGNSFKKMDFKVYLLSLPVFFLITIISFFLNLVLPQILYSIIAILLFIVFITWFRLYVYELQKEGI